YRRRAAGKTTQQRLWATTPGNALDHACYLGTQHVQHLGRHQVGVLAQRSFSGAKSLPILWMALREPEQHDGNVDRLDQLQRRLDPCGLQFLDQRGYSTLRACDGVGNAPLPLTGQRQPRDELRPPNQTLEGCVGAQPLPCLTQSYVFKSATFVVGIALATRGHHLKDDKPRSVDVFEHRRLPKKELGARSPIPQIQRR